MTTTETSNSIEVLFIKCKYFGYEGSFLPLGLLSICTYLEEHSIKTKIIDNFCLSDPNDVDHTFNFIENNNLLFIGFSVFLTNALNTYKTVNVIRQKYPNILLIAGGPHATSLPQEAIDHGFDLVIRGYAEESILQLILLLRNDCNSRSDIDVNCIQGLYSMHNRNTTLARVKLSDLPMIRRDLLDLSRGQYDFGIMLSQVGCPYKCTYCSNLDNSRRNVSARTPRQVVDEMILLSKEYKVNSITFADDVFTLSQKRVKEICSFIRSEPALRNIKWQCGSSVKTTSFELLKEMQEAGLEYYSVCYETFNQETIERTNGHLKMDLEKANQLLDWLLELKLKIWISIIVGWPWETVDDVDSTMRIVNEMQNRSNTISIDCSLLVPVPNTELYDEFHKKYGFTDWWLKDEYLAEGFLQKLGKLHRMFYVLSQNFFKYSYRQIGKFSELLLNIRGRRISFSDKLLLFLHINASKRIRNSKLRRLIEKCITPF
jgi:radical SAM superfamily enzyme YgiQ (UPF0313 family)